MIALIQRVRRASVEVAGRTAGEIGPGLLALIAIERHDGQAQLDKLLNKVLNYRAFSDAAGKMNLSLKETGGGLLLVSQFTLAADTGSGLRPSFTPAAAPQDGKRWFEAFVDAARQQHAKVQTGEFGADMQVSLINDGPVTFWLQARV